MFFQIRLTWPKNAISAQPTGSSHKVDLVMLTTAQINLVIHCCFVLLEILYFAQPIDLIELIGTIFMTHQKLVPGIKLHKIHVIPILKLILT